MIRKGFNGPNLKFFKFFDQKKIGRFKNFNKFFSGSFLFLYNPNIHKLQEK